MTMQMEWVLARIIVIQDDFYDLILLQNVGVCVHSVNLRVGGA